MANKKEREIVELATALTSMIANKHIYDMYLLNLASQAQGIKIIAYFLKRENNTIKTREESNKRNATQQLTQSHSVGFSVKR